MTLLCALLGFVGSALVGLGLLRADPEVWERWLDVLVGER